MKFAQTIAQGAIAFALVVLAATFAYQTWGSTEKTWAEYQACVDSQWNETGLTYLPFDDSVDLFNSRALTFGNNAREACAGHRPEDSPIDE